MKKVFTVAQIRDLEKQVIKGEISYSRMIERLNEMAYDAYLDENTPHVAWCRCPECLEKFKEAKYKLD